MFSHYYINRVCFLGTLLICFQSLFLSPSLHAVVLGDLEYTDSGTYITITGYAGSGGSLTIPSQINGKPVTTIGEDAFFRETGITGVLNLPSSVTTIRSYAFSGCNFSEVNIPSSVTSIYSYVFFSCNSLERINIDAGNTVYSSQDGVFYNKAKSILILCPKKYSGVLNIPSTISSINDQALSGCTDITGAINFPPNLTSIGFYSFAGCTGITSITFSNSSSSLSLTTGAFSGCTGLLTLELPATLRTIGASVFKGCTGLNSVIMNNGPAYVGVSMFSGCNSLTQITLPVSVLKIDDSAFFGCSSLVDIKLPELLQDIRKSAFEDCSNLKDVRIPSSVRWIWSEAFRDCVQLRSAFYWGDAPSMGANVFSGALSEFTVYYLGYASGFTSPTWNGISSVAWDRGFWDFDGDTLDDLLYQYSNTLDVSAQKMNGVGSKTGNIAALFSGSSNVQFLGLIAFDHVGLKDYLVRNLDGSNTHEIWLRDNSGNVTSTYSFDPGSQDWRIVGGYDQNKDGFGDIIWQNTVSGNVTVWYLGANGVTTGSTQLVGSMADFRVTAVGDMDNDGNMDLLWQRYAQSGTSTVVAWYLDAQGDLKAGGSKTIATVSGGWFCVGLADHNGDKILDLVWQNRSTFQILAWLMNASGVKTGSTILDSGTSGQYYVNWQWDFGTLEPMEPWDFNGDDNADLLWQNSSTVAVHEWYMDDSWGMSSSAEIVASADVPGQLVSSSDMNEDGVNDYIWTYREGSRQVVLLWEMNNDRTLKRSVVLGKVAAPYEFRAVGDMNSDGHVDILWQDTNTGKVIAWHMNGAGQRTSFSALTGRIPIYKIQTVADMNGDGNDDIIWQGRTGVNHRIIIWYMDGAGRRSSWVNYGAVAKEWSLCSAADYNNDTYTDLIWFSKTRGQCIGWLLDENNARISHQTIATGITEFDFAHW